MLDIKLLMSLLVIATPAAFAENCPANFQLSAEQDLSDNTKAILCWKQNANTTGELRALISSSTLKQPIAASFALDSENQITKIAFDEQQLTLKKGQITLSVMIESRVHESEHDEDISDLWLLQFDGENISKIFAARTQYAAWATQCENDCQDTLRTTATLTAGASPSNGFNSIRLQKIETTIPYDQPDTKGRSQKSIEEYRFNGKEYIAN